MKISSAVQVSDLASEQGIFVANCMCTPRMLERTERLWQKSQQRCLVPTRLDCEASAAGPTTCGFTRCVFTIVHVTLIDPKS